MPTKRVYGHGSINRRHFRQELGETRKSINTEGFPEDLRTPSGIKISRNLDPKRRGQKSR